MRKISRSLECFLKKYLKLSHISACQRRFTSSFVNNKDAAESFESMVSRCQSEAQRSIVVETYSQASIEAVYHTCVAVGEVKSLVQYTACSSNTSPKDMLLVEFREAGCVEELLYHSKLYCPFFSSGSNHINTLPFLNGRRSTGGRQQGSFRSLSHNSKSGRQRIATAGGALPLINYSLLNNILSNSKKDIWKKNPSTISSIDNISSMKFRSEVHGWDDKVHLSSVIGMESDTSQKMADKFDSLSELDQKMQCQYESVSCTDLGRRLRFLTCRQLELLLSQKEFTASVLPFGSTVNGFGSNSSDLDSVLRLYSPGSALSDAPIGHDNRDEVVSRLKSFSKKLRTYQAIGCANVHPILKARVPIIKHRQLCTGLDCDVSLCESGLQMSELLHTYSSLDRRVAPLVSFVRLWARNNSITSRNPGNFFTNFSLTMLVLFYLIRQGVLPSYQLLQRHAGVRDGSRRSAAAGLQLLLDASRLPEVQQEMQWEQASCLSPSLQQENQHQPAAVLGVSQEDLSLSQLLRGFFIFYRKFDFKKYGASIITGQEIENSTHAAIFIENPLDPELNVTYIVSNLRMKHFRQAIRRAYLTFDIAAKTEHGNTEPFSLWPESR